MLTRGLQVRSNAGASAQRLRRLPSPLVHESATGPPSVTLRPGLTSDAVQAFLRALAGGRAKLPAHVSASRFVSDVEELVAALYASTDTKEVKATVKKHGHFESFFAHHFDFATKADALGVAFERWRVDIAAHAQARRAFYKGQMWLGSYFCTQGSTSMSLNITRVERRPDFDDFVEAQLTFIANNANKEPTLGSYVVSGRMSAGGRTVSLRPVPDSWTKRPENFVMVGMEGTISKAERKGEDLVQFAGSVPILGCDSVVLSAQAPKGFGRAGGGSDYKALGVWAPMLLRLSIRLQTIRNLWREELQRSMKERASGKGTGITGLSELNMMKLLEVAKLGRVLTFELDGADGQDISIRLSGA